MPPIGVPVCLIEKTNGCHFGGAWRAKIRELAGFWGPCPMPIKTAAITAAGQAAMVPPTHKPSAPKASENWLMRITPNRVKRPLYISPANIAAT